jgi:glycosyltransferase involved in cell wall biosynthesis
MRVAALAPCYNTADTIGELVQRISVFIPLTDTFLVDDGSTDDTRAAIERSGAHLLVHKQNRGKGEALRTGYAAVLERDYDGLIALDADLQHLPEHLPEFLEAAPHFDIVVGTRDYNRRNMPLVRWLTNLTTSAVVSALAGTRVRDSQSGYRYLSARAVRDVPLATVKYDMESEQLIRAARMGMKIGEIPIETVYTGSHSYINPFVDTGRFVRMAFRNLLWRPPEAQGKRKGQAPST